MIANKNNTLKSNEIEKLFDLRPSKPKLKKTFGLPSNKPMPCSVGSNQ